VRPAAGLAADAAVCQEVAGVERAVGEECTAEIGEGCASGDNRDVGRGGVRRMMDVLESATGLDIDGDRLVAGDVVWCVAGRCRVLWGVAGCYRVLPCVAVCCMVLQGAAVCCRVLPCVAGCCRVLQGVAGCCGGLQRVAGCVGCCRALQSVAGR